MANSADPDKMAHNEPSSGSALFAKISVLVCRDERVSSKVPSSTALTRAKVSSTVTNIEITVFSDVY